jgi:hypothetical protein
MSVAEQSLLFAFKLAFPEATGDECVVFLLETAGKAYTRQRISDAVTKLLDMTRKKLQVTATERDERRVDLWHLRTPPVGHVGVPRDQIINIDEAGFNYDVANRRFGHAVRGRRARSRQHFARGLHVNIIAGISSTGELYMHVNVDSTNEVTFIDFLDQEVFPPNAGRPRALMWDNLNVHFTAAVLAACTAAGHTVLPCAPYNPDDAPIEYFFGRLEEYLRKHQFEITPATFLAWIYRAAANSSDPHHLNNTFAHCGL